MKNFALYIITFVIALVTGCTSWEGPESSGSTTPINQHVDTITAFRGCINDRREQRVELPRTIGIGPVRATTTVVNLRESARAICDQVRLSEMPAERRALWDAECANLDIPADASVTVLTEAPAPTADPRLVALMAANPALFTDDHATCIANARGNGVPYTGGMAIGGAQVGGVPMIAGGMGVIPGVIGLTGNATRNITFEARGMNPSVTATVSIASLAYERQLTHIYDGASITVADGFDYQVSVICKVGEVVTSSHSRAATPSNSRVLVNNLCGRHRRLNRD